MSSSTIRIDDSKTEENVSFRGKQRAYLRYYLDWGGEPSEEEGGWSEGYGAGWVLHYRPDPDDPDSPDQHFFGGQFALTDREQVVEAAEKYLRAWDADGGA